MVTMVTRMMEEGLMVAEEICDLFVFQKEQKLARPSSPPPRARKRWCVQNPKSFGISLSVPHCKGTHHKCLQHLKEARGTLEGAPKLLISRYSILSWLFVFFGLKEKINLAIFKLELEQLDLSAEQTNDPVG